MDAKIAVEDMTHETYWRQLMRWLVDGVPDQVELTTTPDQVEPGEQVTLRTWHVVREDAQMLFGFLEEVERVVFSRLLGATGVGPRLALTVLSGMEVSELAVAETIPRMEGNTMHTILGPRPGLKKPAAPAPAAAAAPRQADRPAEAPRIRLPMNDATDVR